MTIQTKENEIAVQAIYEKAPCGNKYNRALTVDSKTVETAKKNLSDLEARFYDYLLKIPNHCAVTADVSQLMKCLAMTYSEFNQALGGLIIKKHLAFSPLVNTTTGDVYEGNALRFHPDSSLVGVITGNEWFCYRGQYKHIVGQLYYAAQRNKGRYRLPDEVISREKYEAYNREVNKPFFYNGKHKFQIVFPPFMRNETTFFKSSKLDENNNWVAVD